MEDLLDVRLWLEEILCAALHVDIVDTSMGQGGADIWFTRNGRNYHILLTDQTVSDPTIFTKRGN